MLKRTLVLYMCTSLSLISAQENWRLGIIVEDEGQPIYSWFGHIGLLLEGPSLEIDAGLASAGYPRWGTTKIVFDYGNFSFSAKNFYWNVLRGYLQFFKLAKPYDDFIAASINEGRDINIYWLNLNPIQIQAIKKQLFTDININDNKYLYDYYQDNCATRIRDYIDSALDGQLEDFFSQERDLTYREYVHSLTYSHYWGDLMLYYLQGSMLDKKRTAWEAMFLPRELIGSFQDFSLGNGEPLVSEKLAVYNAPPKNSSKVSANIWQSLFYGGAYALVLAALMYCVLNKKSRVAKIALIPVLLGPLLVAVVFSLIIYITPFFYILGVPQNNLNVLIASPILFYMLIVLAQIFSEKSYPLRQLRIIAQFHLLLCFINILLLLFLAQKNLVPLLLVFPVYLVLSIDFSWQRSFKEQLKYALLTDLIGFWRAVFSRTKARS